MEKVELAKKVVEHMMKNDRFSEWLGIHVNHVEAGDVTLSMTLNADMMNGFHIAHGGICYSLADSALAFAANSHGYQCYSIETSISHLRKLKENDMIVAHAFEKKRGNRVSYYEVEIKDQMGKLVAIFRGTVYNSGEKWFEK